MFNLKFLASILICFSLAACTANTSSTNPMGNIQKVEQGTITQIKKIATTKDSNPLGSTIGVSVGSGGHAGVYGAFDIGRFFSAMTKPTHHLELIVKKQKGGFVAVTQPLGGNFKVGDRVKILLRNGLAVVQH
jgi:outer membrane lipoprotein SlyB